MGYRSEVAFLLKKEAHDRLLADIESIDDEDLRDEVRDLLKSFTVRRYKSGAVLYHGDWFKWYTEEYADVGFIHQWLYAQPPQDYRYVTIGEEYDDIGNTGDFFLETPQYDSIDVVRSIHIPKGGRKCS